MFAEGSSGTCIPVRIRNAFAELKGEKIAADVFIARTEFAENGAGQLELNTISPAALFIHKRGHRVELLKVKTRQVHPFDYLCSLKAGVF